MQLGATWARSGNLEASVEMFENPVNELHRILGFSHPDTPDTQPYRDALIKLLLHYSSRPDDVLRQTPARQF